MPGLSATTMILSEAMPKRVNNCGEFYMITGRAQFNVLPSCLAKSSEFGSALLKYYVNVQVFNA